MADWAMRVDGLGKRFTVGRKAPYFTLRETIAEWAARPLRWRGSSGANAPSADGLVETANTLWAVRDASFEIKQGEVVGIIGRNGAGKSTLLKLLSRILEPDRGRAALRGQVGALLEVGTGFHPELTGRENIFLSGALLGMRRAELVRKFDEIVAFAETERFLDTPVKHYSSGMYMRLAFSVAAHLQPDILIVDEVLAVGDATFQKKCLRAMEQFGGQGRTVLFVSHNMPAVTRLCPRTLLMEQGRVVADGPSETVIHRYLRRDSGNAAEQLWSNPDKAPGNHIARLRAVRIKDAGGLVAARIDIRQPVRLELEFDVLEPGHLLTPNLHLYNDEGQCIFVTADSSCEAQTQPRSPGSYRAWATIPGNYLAEGTVVVHVALSTMNPTLVHFHELDAAAFEVVDSMDGNSVRGTYAGSIPGVVRPLLAWDTVFDQVTARRDAA